MTNGEAKWGDLGDSTLVNIRDSLPPLNWKHKETKLCYRSLGAPLCRVRSQTICQQLFSCDNKIPDIINLRRFWLKKIFRSIKTGKMRQQNPLTVVHTVSKVTKEGNKCLCALLLASTHLLCSPSRQTVHFCAGIQTLPAHLLHFNFELCECKDHAVSPTVDTVSAKYLSCSAHRQYVVVKSLEFCSF